MQGTSIGYEPARGDALADELLGRLAVSPEPTDLAGLEQLTRALAADRAHAVDALAGHERLLAQLSAVHAAVAARASLQELLRAVAHGALALIRADFGTLELGGDASPIHLTIGPGGAPPTTIPPAAAPADGSAGWEVAAVPFHVAADAPGSLLVGSRQRGRVFTRAERDLLRRYADHAGLAVAAARAGETSQRAFVDALTGLPGRELFLDRLERALARAQRDGTTVTVLFVDLDRFKLVNDSLGHLAGDQLLTEVAARLATCLRRSDTIGRLGGDEFVALLHDGEGHRNPRRVAERLIETLQQPFRIQGRDVFVSASIGIAVGAEQPNDILRHADLAMYRAKRLGKGRWVFFEPSMQSEALDRLELEADLRRAVERNELKLQYQPIMELGGGRIVAVEALLRWEHPSRGLLAPAAFIELAEETGLIVSMGRWVLGEACRQAGAWQRLYPCDPPLAIAVNLSGVQLARPELIDEVREAIGDRIDPSSLILEITESVLMQDGNQVVERLNELKELGVRLAIDDFGTGYSSLRYLSRFRVDILKIAKPFVDGIGRRSPEETALSRAIVDLGIVLELQTVAEGIELAEQEVELQGLGCLLGQGFLFAEPLSAESLAALLGEGRRAAA